MMLFLGLKRWALPIGAILSFLVGLLWAPVPTSAQNDPVIGDPMPFQILINGSWNNDDRFKYIIQSNLKLTMPPQTGLASDRTVLSEGTFSWTYAMKRGCKLTKGASRGTGRLAIEVVVSYLSGGFTANVQWPDMFTEQFEVQCPNQDPQPSAGPSLLASQVLVLLTAGPPKPFQDGQSAQGSWKLRTPCSVKPGAPAQVTKAADADAWPAAGPLYKPVAALNAIQAGLVGAPIKGINAKGAVVGLTLPGYTALEGGSDPGFPRPDIHLAGSLSGSCLGFKVAEVKLQPVTIFLAQEIKNDSCKRDAVLSHEREHYNRMAKHREEFVQDALQQLRAMKDFIPTPDRPIYVAAAGHAKNVADLLNTLLYARIRVQVSAEAAQEQVDWDTADSARVIAKCRNWPQAPP